MVVALFIVGIVWVAVFVLALAVCYTAARADHDAELEHTRLTSAARASDHTSDTRCDRALEPAAG